MDDEEYYNALNILSEYHSKVPRCLPELDVSFSHEGEEKVDLTNPKHTNYQHNFDSAREIGLKGIKKIQHLADKGHTKAITKLGQYYQFGFDLISVSIRDAMNLYKIAAEKGNPDAQTHLGYCYFDNHGVEQDKEELAIHWLSKAASNSPPSDFARMLLHRIGILAEEEVQENITNVEAKAGNSDPIAQFHVGYYFCKSKPSSSYNTRAFSPQIPRGVHWYKESAFNRNAIGQLSYGYCYRAGFAVERVAEFALLWYIRAGNQGYYRAFYNIGNCFLLGTGIPKDKKRAYEYYFKAAELEHHGAQLLVACEYQVGKELPKDDKKAAYWFEKAARLGNLTAMYKIAMMYETGDGVEQNMEKAVKWYYKGHLKKHPESTQKINTPEAETVLRNRRNRKFWRTARIILYGHLKGDPECPLTWLPPEIIVVILRFLKHDFHSIKWPK